MVGGSVSGLAEDAIVTRHSAALGVTVPLFGADRTRPAAQLHIGRLSIGSQRHGIFRIGILPALIAQGVRIEFTTQPADPSALEDLTPALRLLAKDAAAELHDVSIVIGRSAVLTAAEGKPGSGESLLLTCVAIPGGDTPKTATLIITGRKAGEVSYDLNGARKVLNVFKSTNPNPTL